MTGPARIVLTSGGEPRAFDAPSVVIGRAADADLVVEGGPVSRRHCEVTIRSDGLWVRDLGSSRGTWLDGARLLAPSRAAPGARLRLGEGGPEVIVSSVGADFGAATRKGRGEFALGLLLGAAAGIALLAFAEGSAGWVDALRRL